MLIGASSAAVSPSKLQAEHSLMESVTLQQCVRYSSIADAMPLDSTKNATYKEPSPDEFVKTEKEPEPNYAMLKKNIVYPEQARRAGLQGKVIVRVLIGKDGMPKPGKVKIEDSSNEIFNQVSIDAIMKTPFTPAIQLGQPIEVWVTVPLNYQLRDPIKVEEPKIGDSIKVEKEPEPNYTLLKRNTVFPAEALRAGIQGQVIVRVLVGKDGMPKPGKIRVEYTSNEIFNQAAIDAVMKTPFTPAIQKGQPVEVWVTVPMNFQLR